MIVFTNDITAISFKVNALPVLKPYHPIQTKIPPISVINYSAVVSLYFFRDLSLLLILILDTPDVIYYGTSKDNLSIKLLNPTTAPYPMSYRTVNHNYPYKYKIVKGINLIRSAIEPDKMETAIVQNII